MAKDCQTQKKKRIERKQVSCTMSTGKICFDLSGKTSTAVWESAKWAAQLLAGRERKGWSITSSDWDKIKNLPSDVRAKFIQYGLIEGEKSETVPVLSVLLEKYIASRADKSQAHHRRLRICLTEYFGKDKRIDLITPAEAAGIRDYLLHHRKKPKGKKGGCLSPATVNRRIRSCKSLFRFAC